MNDYMNNWGAVIADTKIDEDDLKPYFVFLKSILLIEDSLTLKRVIQIILEISFELTKYRLYNTLFFHFFSG